jgi:predicted phosphodiesterase
MTRTQVLEKALELCESQPLQTVARNLHSEYPTLFRTVNSARTAIQYRRGAGGDQNRKYVKGAPRLSNIAEGLAKLRVQPKGDDPEITITGAKVGILSDIHIPNHDPEALRIALEATADCDHIILNGDIIDFDQISRFTSEPSMSAWEEIRELQGFLTLLRQMHPGKRIIYKLGNHETRMRRYLLTQARELADAEPLTYESLFLSKELGIEVVRENRIMLGKLSVLHGHEIPVNGGVNPARSAYLKVKSSVIIGHLHQVSYHSEADLNGSRTGCWSMGCLCTLTPSYSRFAYLRWSHGFAIVDVAEDGSFHCHNKQIIDGKVL